MFSSAPVSLRSFACRWIFLTDRTDYNFFLMLFFIRWYFSPIIFRRLPALERGNSRVDFLYSAACQRLPKRKEIKKHNQATENLSPAIIVVCIASDILFLFCCTHLEMMMLWAFACMSVHRIVVPYNLLLFFFSLFPTVAVVLVAHVWLCILVFLPLSELSVLSFPFFHISNSSM